MRVVFMGTPAFAVPALTLLARQHEVVAVLTRPDAVRGRGKKLVASPVKTKAQELGIEVIDCARVSDEIVERVAALKASVGCVAAFGAILPRQLLDAFQWGCVNVHGSLLPRWRGAAPIARAILTGDEVTGVSIMKVEEGLDTGPVALMSQTLCAGKDLATLEDELSWTGASLLLDTLALMDSGKIQWVAQDEAEATYANRLQKGELDLDPELEVIEAWRHVLASNDAHPCRALVGKALVRVRAAIPCPGVSLDPGEVGLMGESLSLGCCGGALELQNITPAGKKPMAARAWVRGLKETPTSWKRP